MGRKRVLTDEQRLQNKQKHREKSYKVWSPSFENQPYDYVDKELIADKPDGKTDIELAKKLGRSAHALQNKRYIMKKQEKLMKEKADAKRRKQEEAQRIPQKGEPNYFSKLFPNGIFYPNARRMFCG